MYDFIVFIGVFAVGMAVTNKWPCALVTAILVSVLYSGYRQYQLRGQLSRYENEMYETFTDEPSSTKRRRKSHKKKRRQREDTDSDTDATNTDATDTDADTDDEGDNQVRKMLKKRKYPTGKYTFDPEASYKHTSRSMSKPQVRGLRKDTKALLDTQTKLMGTLKEMAPVLEQGKSIIGAFDSYFGKGSGSEGDLTYMKKRLGITGGTSPP